MLFRSATGESQIQVGGPVARLGENLASFSKNGIQVYRWARKTKKDRKGKSIKFTGIEPLWKVDGVPGGAELICSGSAIVSSGGDEVALIDSAKKTVEWKTKVKGTAHGLASAGGRLYVSTDEGFIYCFSGKDNAGQATKPARKRALPGHLGTYADAADEILKN